MAWMGKWSITSREHRYHYHYHCLLDENIGIITILEYLVFVHHDNDDNNKYHSMNI